MKNSKVKPTKQDYKEMAILNHMIAKGDHLTLKTSFESIWVQKIFEVYMEAETKSEEIGTFYKYWKLLEAKGVKSLSEKYLKILLSYDFEQYFNEYIYNKHIK